MNNRFVSGLALAVILLGFTSMACAAGATDNDSHSGVVMLSDKGAGQLGGPIGAGLVLVGGGIGIGRVSGSACEAIARQPEAGGRIFTTMIIGAAIIEGTTLFGVVVCLLTIL